ncbi:MAG: PEP-CTERM sorting domain-containing protein [Pseudomonadota bacterium]
MPPHTQRLAALALCAGLAAGPVTATVLTAEQLNVYRDGSSADWLLGNNRLLGDAFDNGNPLVGPAFSSTGTAATYNLLGAASAGVVSLAAREQNGQLLLDPNFGSVSPNAAGASGTSLRLRLLTNISNAGGGLNIGQTFAATLRLSLSAAPDPGQTFGLRLTDGGIATSNNDVVELFWSGNASGGNIVFRKQDFDLGLVSGLGSAAVAAPAHAAMLVLSLAHNEVDSNLISGSYNYADSNGQLLGSFTTFGNRAVAFQGESHTRVELRATGLTAPVPEPGTWALMGAGLALLLGRRARRAT